MTAGSEQPPAAVVVDAGGLVDPDTATVDALCRLQLAARRSGSSVELRGVPPALADMLALAGLDQVLGVQVCGQAEQGEQARGVEEEADAGDAAV